MRRRNLYLWRRILTGAGLLLLVAVAACATDGGEAITVRVDYSHDEFATQFIRYFPNQIQAHPGDTIRFLQDWTGEAHTVTFGTTVTEATNIAVPLFEEYGHLPEDQVPPGGARGVLRRRVFAASPLQRMCEPHPKAERKSLSWSTRPWRSPA